METFGARLRLCRKLEGLTRVQLAVGVECHPATIGRWERDEDVPSFKAGCRLALFLNKSGFFLAGIVDNPAPGIQLSPDEANLIADYRALGKDGALWRESIRDARRAREATRA